MEQPEDGIPGDRAQREADSQVNQIDQSDIELAVFHDAPSRRGAPQVKRISIDTSAGLIHLHSSAEQVQQDERNALGSPLIFQHLAHFAD